MKAGQTCSNCAAFSALTTECRRKSPTPMPIPGKNGEVRVLKLFPPQEPDNWCYEWVPEQALQH